MAAVLRVKRRIDEDPVEALVIACKRRKESEEKTEKSDNPFTTILKLTSTVQSLENDISLLLPANDQEDIWKSKLRHKVDISKKIREQRKEFSENSRFKVVNCFRQVSTEEGGDGGTEKKKVIVFDIESTQKSSRENTVQDTQDDTNYVYDIYYGNTKMEYDFTSVDGLVDIMPYSSFDFGTMQDMSDEEPIADDEDDSNDENNWRNDYPDSDHSVNEDDMRLAAQMGNLNIDEANDLSSSDDEGLIYGIESDPQDVEYYGETYAKYKARIRREFNDENESSNEEYESSSGSGGAGSDDEEDAVLRFM